MAKLRRVTPFKQKARRIKKTKNEPEELDQRVVDLEMRTISDAARARTQLELMTNEELARVQQVAAQNALNLFNKLLEEISRRVPDMTDEVLTTALLSVWDKVSGKK